MDTRLLEYMLVIAREGSLSKAADKIHISQSALSQNLSKIEQELQSPLFARVNKRLVPTDIGRCYLAGARDMVQIKKDTYQKISNLARQEHNTIRMCVCPQVYISLGGLILTRIKEAFPQVHLDLQETESGLSKEYLLNDVADAAILSTDNVSNRLLDFFPLCHESLSLAVPSAMSWEGDRIDFERLQNCAFVYPARGTFLYSLTLPLLTERKLIFQNVYTADSISGIRLLAEYGYGAALLPQRTALTLTGCRRYEWVPPAGYEIVYGISKYSKRKALLHSMFHTLKSCF